MAAPKWKMGIALYSFNKHPFTAALEKVDSAHVKYVEGFSFYMLGKDFGDSTLGDLSPAGIARMKKMLQDKGLSMESIYVDARGAAGWKKYFNLAEALGAHYLTCEPAKDQWDLADSLAGVYGIPIAIHEHSREHSAYWHPDSVLAAMKGHPNFGACADLGHWARSGLDPVECLKKLKGHIFGIHLKDIDSLNNPNAADVIVGTGVINYPAVVRELKNQGYKGMIYMECEHKMDNNLPDVIQSLKYFNSL
jgi:sugar phosphate isomerase/epimerase